MKGRLLALFFSHLALLFREGVPLTSALDVLQEPQPPGASSQVNVFTTIWIPPRRARAMLKS